MDQIQDTHSVVSNQKLCPKFWRMEIDAPVIKKQARPGQFVHIRVQDSLQPFFRRPFSIYRAQKHIEIFYEAVGPGTKILSSKKPGDAVDVIGPVGKGFSLPPEGTRQIVMIGGGIGIAPFLFLSDQLKDKGYDLLVLYGGRSGDHVYPMEEFKQNGCSVFVATDDGSQGVKGRVSELFRHVEVDPRTTFIYTCGPNPMMAAVQAFARDNALRGEAACEEVMACALGACLGCSIKTTEGFRTVCYDGPVFDLQKVMFEH